MFNFLKGDKEMVNRKFLKKLSTIIIGLGVMAFSFTSVWAISPVDLLKKINGYQNKTSVLNDYDCFIKPNLLENGFDDSNVKTAESFLNKKNKDNPSEGLSKFKNYVCHRLLFAQSKIFIIEQNIDDETLKLEKDNHIHTILESLEKNSNIWAVKEEIENIKLCIQNCKSISNVTLVDFSLKCVEQKQQLFYENYHALHSHINSALSHIKTYRANQICQK